MIGLDLNFLLEMLMLMMLNSLKVVDLSELLVIAFAFAIAMQVYPSLLVVLVAPDYIGLHLVVEVVENRKLYQAIALKWLSNINPNWMLYFYLTQILYGMDSEIFRNIVNYSRLLPFLSLF